MKPFTSNNMKPINTKLFTTILCLGMGLLLQAQEEKPELTLTVSYYATNNKIPYLKLHTQVRKEKTIENVGSMPVKVYLDEESDAALVGQVTTNEKGWAKLVLPPALKDAWSTAPKHTFIAKTPETKAFAESSSETEVAKARIRIDTLSEEGTRNITASLLEFNGTDWVPTGDVELKIGVQRQGGILPISDEESYTTDSTGVATAEFKRDSLPGDAKGNLVIVARTEDHELYGNVVEEKTLPWGVVINKKNEFFGKRSLWATGDKVPVWLLAIALSVIVSVWSVILYLVYNIVQLRKLGRSEEQQKIKVPEMTLVSPPAEMKTGPLT